MDGDAGWINRHSWVKGGLLEKQLDGCVTERDPRIDALLACLVDCAAVDEFIHNDEPMMAVVFW